MTRRENGFFPEVALLLGQLQTLSALRKSTGLLAHFRFSLNQSEAIACLAGNACKSAGFDSSAVLSNATIANYGATSTPQVKLIC